MWAIDGGLKKSGFSVNGQYFMRWLGNFEADGPMPLASTFDHGFELSTGKFVVPKKLLLYARGSKVFGQFANPYEYGGGFKWYFLPTTSVDDGRGDANLQGAIQRGLHPIYRGHERLGPHAANGIGFLKPWSPAMPPDVPRAFGLPARLPS
jgi:hypothetical protein